MMAMALNMMKRLMMQARNLAAPVQVQVLKLVNTALKLCLN